MYHERAYLHPPLALHFFHPFRPLYFYDTLGLQRGYLSLLNFINLGVLFTTRFHFHPFNLGYHTFHILHGRSFTDHAYCLGPYNDEPLVSVSARPPLRTTFRI